MKYIRITFRIILGLVFIFSGFVKGIDPMGSVIKFTEYFEVFHITWLGSFVLALSILLSTAELLIGICLVIGLRMKVTAWASLLFMSFFTLLTLYSAIFSPVSDCGCFGDALVLTNWQTFYKNIVLIAIAIFIFYSRNHYQPYTCALAEWGLVAFFALTGIGLSVYCYQHLPIIDFRPYSIGSHIPSKMGNPDRLPEDVYETQLFYQKNGVVKEFTLKNYPWQDTTWKWVKTNSVLVTKGYTPPIHGFSITTGNNEEITNQVLADTSYSFIFISYDLSKVNEGVWKKITGYYQFAQDQSHKFYYLTASTPEDANQMKIKQVLPFDFQYSDQTVLKTIIRSNPGLMVLKDGVVLGLWHYNDLPETTYFRGNILSKLVTDFHKRTEWKNTILLGMSFMLIIFTLLGLKRHNKS